MPTVVRALADAGVVVEVIHPVEQAVDLSRVRVEHDLYVLRRMSGLALSLAGALHEAGATIVNPYPASAALHDRIIATRTLQLADVPVPATYVAADAAALAPQLEDGPLVIKPHHGGRGHGVRIVRSAAELAEIDTGREPVFAQRYHPPRGRDRKIYVIGDQVFGVKKVFPRRTEEEKLGEPFTLTPELRDIGLRCGRAFGIDLFGIDVVESAGQLYVVDMDGIPGYKGVPDAPRLLAQYFCEAAQRAARGESVPQAAAATALREFLP